MTYWNDPDRTNPQSSELFAGYFMGNITGYTTHVDSFNTFFPESAQFLNDEMERVSRSIGGK